MWLVTFCMAIYNEIEQKTRLEHDTIRKIVTRAIKWSGFEDIHKILIYVRDLDRSGWIPWVADATTLFQDI